MLGTLTNSLFTCHEGQVGGRGLSPRIWTKPKGSALSPDGASNAYWFADDFTSFGVSALIGTGTSATVGYYASGGGAYTSYEDTGGLISQIPYRGGAIKFLSDGSDNDEITLQAGSLLAAPFWINKAAGYSKLLCYECRFRITTPSTAAAMLVVATSVNVFMGLAEEGSAASNFIDDSGVLASKDFIGFKIDQTILKGSTLTFTYRKAGQTVQVPIADITGNLSSGTVLAPATWYKAGFVYDPDALTSERIKVYLDNVQVSCDAANGGSSAAKVPGITAALVEAATFPDAQCLSPILSIQNGGAQANQVDFDWHACWQAG